MHFAVTPTYVRGCRLSDEEIEKIAPVVGDLHLYRCPREPNGAMRTLAGVSAPVKANLLPPILEPRLTAIGPHAFMLRGLEELKTQRGWVYVLQEWRVEERQRAAQSDPI